MTSWTNTRRLLIEDDLKALPDGPVERATHPYPADRQERLQSTLFTWFTEHADLCDRDARILTYGKMMGWKWNPEVTNRMPCKACFRIMTDAFPVPAYGPWRDVPNDRIRAPRARKRNANKADQSAPSNIYAYQLADGSTRYQAKLTLPGLNKRPSKRGFVSKMDAQQWINEQFDEYRANRTQLLADYLSSPEGKAKDSQSKKARSRRPYDAEVTARTKPWLRGPKPFGPLKYRSVYNKWANVKDGDSGVRVYRVAETAMDSFIATFSLRDEMMWDDLAELNN